MANIGFLNNNQANWT